MSEYKTAEYLFCPHCGSKTRNRAVEGHIIKECVFECGFAFFNNPTPVVAVVVETPDGVVLAHNVAWPPGMRSIITGFVDPNELPVETAIRETKEELGLDAYDPEFIGHYMFHQKNQLIIGYSVKAQGHITLNHELDEYKVIPVEKLQAWPGATGQTVADWLEKRNQAKWP